MKKFFAGLLAVLLLLGGVPTGARAAESEAEGYIFALREDVPVMRLFAAVPGVQEVSAAHGVYRADTLEEIAAFAPPAAIAYITPDVAVQQHAMPNDPDIASGRAWQLPMIDMDYAWETGVTGKGVRVGIVDSGVRRTHEEIDPTLVKPGSYYSPANDKGERQPGVPGTEEPGGPTKPTNTHGSFVAGLISAKANNEKGFAGVAPGVELIPLVAFDGGPTLLSAIVTAIYAGVDDYQCKVLNMSLGLYREDFPGQPPELLKPLDEAIAHARSKGVILVASVGNRGGTSLSYPAACEGVIGVGAVNENGVKAGISQYNASVDLTAPGEGVYSLDWKSDNGYVPGSGTSYSAPLVTAAAALALELDPGLTAEEILGLLAQTAVDKGEPGRDDLYGYGLLNVSAFLREVARVTKLVTPEGTVLSVRYRRLTAGKDVTVLAAAYDAKGRMLDVAACDAVVGPQGILTAENLRLTAEGAVKAKVFLLDKATGAPLEAAEELNLS